MKYIEIFQHDEFSENTTVLNEDIKAYNSI